MIKCSNAIAHASKSLRIGFCRYGRGGTVSAASKSNRAGEGRTFPAFFGLTGRVAVNIKDFEAVRVSYPGFLDDIERLAR